MVPEVPEGSFLEPARQPWPLRSAMHLRRGNVYDRGLHRLHNRSECTREMNRVRHSQRRCGIFAYGPLATSLNPRISVFMATYLQAVSRPAFFFGEAKPDLRQSRAD